tara:strand:- start:781 stop:1626 length:846 start_codon:yes stop_codon:yes gene_type:complete
MAAEGLTRQERIRIKKAISAEVQDDDMEFLQLWKKDQLNYIRFFEEMKEKNPEMSVDDMILQFKTMLLDGVLEFLREERPELNNFKRAFKMESDIADCENKANLKLGAAIKFNERCRNIDELYKRALIAYRETAKSNDDINSYDTYMMLFLKNLPEDNDFDPNKEFDEEDVSTFSNSELGQDEIKFLIWLSLIPEHNMKSLFLFDSSERKLEKKRNQTKMEMLNRSNVLPEGSVSEISKFLGGTKPKKSRKTKHGKKKNQKKNQKKSRKVTHSKKNRAAKK